MSLATVITICAVVAQIAFEGQDWRSLVNHTPPNTVPLTGTQFWDYKSTGAGANTTNSNRASRQLSDAQATNYTVEKVLSPWVPGYYN
jgi:hypothetical protein